MKCPFQQHLWSAMSIAAGCALLLGCAGGKAGRGPYAPQSESARDPAAAQRLTMEAANIMDSDPDKAEKLLREALTNDLYYGPAHNNLGVLLLKRDDLYSAAGEFEWGRKLLPGHPDPRVNLALTLEKAGRIDEAILTYATALEVYPGYVAAVQALTRAQLRHNRADDLTTGMLEDIAFRGDSPQWREWARERLAFRTGEDAR